MIEGEKNETRPAQLFFWLCILAKQSMRRFK